MKNIKILFLFIFIMFFAINSPVSSATADNQDIEQLVESAITGNAEAQFKLGLMYKLGQGVNQDYGKAIEWWEKAAQAGNSNAQFSLGAMYFFGYGVAQDFDRARELWEKADQKNMEMAQFYLGAMYYKGYGVAKDYDKAKDYFGIACANDLRQGCDAFTKLCREGNIDFLN